jgi:hypothetical protein
MNWLMKLPSTCVLMKLTKLITLKRGHLLYKATFSLQNGWSDLQEGGLLLSWYNWKQRWKFLSDQCISPIHMCSDETPIHMCSDETPIHMCSDETPIHMCSDETPIHMCSDETPIHMCSDETPIHMCSDETPIHMCNNIVIFAYM